MVKSDIGAVKEEQLSIKRRYEFAKPKNLLTSLTDFAGFNSVIAAILVGSVL